MKQKMFMALTSVASLLGCGPPSAQLSAQHPSAKDDYEGAVQDWMDEGRPIATGRGWASYRYWAYAPADVNKLQSEVASGFQRLCASAGGKVVPTSCAICPPNMKLCASDQNLFGIATQWEDGRPRGGYQVVHYSGSQIDELLSEAGATQAFDQQSAAARKEKNEKRAAEGRKHEEEMVQRTLELRQNLKTGDRGLIENRKIEYDRAFEEFLVIEVKRPLAHIQLFNPQETVWIEIDKLRAFGHGCVAGHNIC